MTPIYHEALTRDAIRMLLDERERQKKDHGYTIEHDAQYQREELTRAAEAFLLAARGKTDLANSAWPWPSNPADFQRFQGDLLARAGAMILAQLEACMASHAAGVPVGSQPVRRDVADLLDGLKFPFVSYHQRKVEDERSLERPHKAFYLVSDAERNGVKGRFQLFSLAGKQWVLIASIKAPEVRELLEDRLPDEIMWSLPDLPAAARSEVADCAQGAQMLVNATPPPLDAAALINIVHSLHQGYCPACSAIFQPGAARAIGGEACVQCGFFISDQDAAAAVDAYHDIMDESLFVFVRWQAEREGKDIDAALRRIKLLRQQPLT